MRKATPNRESEEDEECAQKRISPADDIRDPREKHGKAHVGERVRDSHPIDPFEITKVRPDREEARGDYRGINERQKQTQA